MAEIKKVYAEDYPKVLPLLKEFNNPDITDSDWKKLFSKHWEISEDYFGYMALEDDEVVGFLGGIFSSREINGKLEKFCNLSTWIVKEDHRGQSLPLLFKFLQDKEYTFTDLTANKVAKILKKVGFKEIDSHLHVVLPLPNLNPFKGKLKIFSEPEEIQALLNPAEQKIFSDHKSLDCFHILIKKGNGYSYLIYDIVRKKRLPVARMHYISSIDFLKNNYLQASLQLCLKAKVFGFLVGNHFLGEQKLPFTLLIPQKQSLLFKSEHIQKEEMDSIYSEFQVLGIRN